MKYNLFKPETGINDERALYASDIMLNKKDNMFYLFAGFGEAVIMAYENKTAWHGFVERLCTLIKDGADMPYQPTMRTKAKGDILTITSSHKETTFCIKRTAEPLPDEQAGAMPQNKSVTMLCPNFADILNQTRAMMLKYPSVRFVMLDDVTGYLPDCELWQMQRELNDIAHESNALVLYGIETRPENDTMQGMEEYFAGHERNVCYLLDDTYHETNFLWFVYGSPERKRLVYAIDEEGNVIIPTISENNGTPASLSKLLLLELLCKRFAYKMVSYKTLAYLLRGALNNAYAPDTIKTYIALAIDHGILQKSGEGEKATLIYAESNSNRKTYKGNVAISAKVYNKPCKSGNGKRRPFIKFGETKLLFGEVANKFVWAINQAIISGKELDFRTTTKHKNILVALIADDEQVQACKEKLTTYAESKAFAANIDVVGITPEITDAQFLIEYKDLYGKFMPDFYFVLNLQDVKGNYVDDPLPFVKELAKYAKSKSFALIAHANKEWKYYDCLDPYQFPDLIEDETMCFISKELPELYDFKSKCGKYYTFARYKITSNGELAKPCSYTEKIAYLDSAIAYSCRWSERVGCTRENLRDIYGEPLTDTQIKDAKWLKIAYEKEGRIFYRPEDKR